MPVPRNIPKKLEIQIQKLTRQKNKEELLHSCFDFVVSKNSGERINVFSKFTRLYKLDIDDILETKGYAHCTTMNYLLRTILINSGKFKDADINTKLTNIWFLIPHQYLEIKVSQNKKIIADPWAKQFGIPFGKYAHGFSAGTILRTKR